MAFQNRHDKLFISIPSMAFAVENYGISLQKYFSLEF